MNDSIRHRASNVERRASEWLPLDTARNSFTWLVTGPDPLSIDGRDFAGLPSRSIPLDEVRDRLLDPHCPRATRDTVWIYLVRRARRDGATWMVASVGMALPGLAGTARWLAARYRGDRADIHAAVLSGFIEALATVDLRGPGVVYRLQWAARRAGQAALEESLDAPVPSLSAFESRAPRASHGHPDLVLARAVGDGVLTPIEADLISATRLGEESVTQWAHAHSRSVHAVAKARERAEHRLADYLADSVVTADGGLDSDDPVADVVMSTITNDETVTDLSTSADESLAVSGRRRNGRPDTPKKLSRLVSKSTSKTGLLRDGDTTPTSPDPAASEPTPEVRRCA